MNISLSEGVRKAGGGTDGGDQHTARSALL